VVAHLIRSTVQLQPKVSGRGFQLGLRSPMATDPKLNATKTEADNAEATNDAQGL
jgi:hypothetical protein